MKIPWREKKLNLDKVLTEKYTKKTNKNLFLYAKKGITNLLLALSVRWTNLNINKKYGEISNNNFSIYNIKKL